MPSVAMTETPGVSVAARTAATCRSGQLETNHESGRARNPSRATQRPASAVPEMIRLTSEIADVGAREHAVEGRREDGRSCEREPDHASDRLDGAHERHGEHHELVRRQA